MKIVMTRDDVKNILIRYIFTNYAQAIGINSPDEIQFNSDALLYNELIFEKKESNTEGENYEHL